MTHIRRSVFLCFSITTVFETNEKLSRTSLTNKILAVKMNKVVYGWNMFSTICARNVSIILVATSCEYKNLHYIAYAMLDSIIITVS